MDTGEIEGVILVKSLLLAILEALVGMVSAPAERLDLVLVLGDSITSESIDVVTDGLGKMTFAHSGL